MHEEFDACLRAEGSGRIAIIPGSADESAKIGIDNLASTKMIIDKRRGRGHPDVASVLYEVVVQGLTKAQLPARGQVSAVTQIEIQITAVRILCMKKSARNLQLTRALSGCGSDTRHPGE